MISRIYHQNRQAKLVSELLERKKLKISLSTVQIKCYTESNEIAKKHASVRIYTVQLQHLNQFADFCTE